MLRLGFTINAEVKRVQSRLPGLRAPWLHNGNLIKALDLSDEDKERKEKYYESLTEKEKEVISKYYKLFLKMEKYSNGEGGESTRDKKFAAFMREKFEEHA